MKSSKMLLSVLITFFISNSVANSQTKPVFHGNNQHTGSYNTTGIEKSPVVKWKFKTGGKIFSSPALSNGVIYIGSGDNSLYAIDSSSGKQLWKFTTGGEVHSSPAVSDDTVFFNSNDGYFYAVDTKTGNMKWSFKTEGEKHFTAKGIHGMKPSDQLFSDPWDFYLSSPVVSYGKVFFGSGDGYIYALNVENGESVWKFKTNNVVHSSPAIYDGMVYCGSWDTYFYALDAETGAKIWSRKTGDDFNSFNQTGIQSSPTISDGLVYFGCRDSNVYALDAKTGKKKWMRYNAQSWILNTPAVSDSILYYGTSDTSLFIAVDAKTGRDKFTFNAKTYIYSSPVIVNGVAYFGTFGGTFIALDVKSNKKLWEFQTDSYIENSSKTLSKTGTIDFAAIAGSKDTGYFDTMIYVMDQIYKLGSIISTPVVDNGVIYFGSADGNLYALSNDTATSVKESSPDEFRLYGNYPNPFNPSTTISYHIPKLSDVNLTVFNLNGQAVDTLVNRVENAGRHSVVWNGKDYSGRQLASGIYLYRLKAGDVTKTQKMTFIR